MTELSELPSDYGWFVESIAQIGRTNDPDEITKIIMDSMTKAGLNEGDELAAVTVLVFQYCGARVLIQNLDSVISNFPERSSPQTEIARSIAASFLRAIIYEFQNLEGYAEQKNTPWAVAMRIADSMLGKLIQDLKVMEVEVTGPKHH